MLPTAARCAAQASGSSAIAKSLERLLPKPSERPPSLSSGASALPRILSRTPDNGIGRRVHQVRWSEKQIADCYWVVSRTQFKLGGAHGKAWGKLYWKGKLVSEKEERIRGDLKYTWAEGPSKPTRPAQADAARPATSTEPQRATA
ncbi:hypothetical protein BD626DRAFT_626734 [Schizophyllum amplum]|uniref:Uncharacterized protein n=1 Tax=Schizophyllum amplum TaxID=97359 RepID=A0A550CUG6_9AGAR|nr:hypothetical protein BD626DRAFT_626734 [Auriculariopsis ampla]